MTARSQGPDWAVYQGAQGKWGLTNDSFAIAQIGGTYGGRLNWQSTYASQVRAILAKGRRAHTYIWFQVGGSQSIAKGVLDAMLPHLGLPKGAIVALDYEAGASDSKTSNTKAVAYGMRRIKAAGYTPMYYSYKPYTEAHINSSALVKEFGDDCLWIAAYPFVHSVSGPDMRYFPSMEGVGIWQFTDKYAHDNGLDGNVDLTGITQNGYGKKPVTVVAKPAPKEDDFMAHQDWRPVAKHYYGMAYAHGTAATYEDNGLTKQKGKLDSGVAYPFYEYKHGAVDVGSAWVNAADVALAFNPLAEGHKAPVRNVKDSVMSYTDKNGNPATAPVKAGKWNAFGTTDTTIDLGGGQTAPIADFEVFL